MNTAGPLINQVRAEVVEIADKSIHVLWKGLELNLHSVSPDIIVRLLSEIADECVKPAFVSSN